MNPKIETLLRKKLEKSPISVATAYDYPSSRLVREAGIDIILLGDSVGTNVLGYTDEREVTMRDMLHHLGAVVRSLTSQGAIVAVGLDCGFPLVAWVTRRSAADLALRPGLAVRASIKATAIHLIRGDD